eukprot:457943-Amphidinium_carterae.1
MKKVHALRIESDRFAGALPDSGMRAMMAVTTFEVYRNCFTGSLSDGGVRAMMAVTYFSCSKNSLAGTLPGKGLRQVTRLAASNNRFTGALSDGGIWKAAKYLELYRNRLTGSLPECISAVSWAYIGDNFFAGTVAESPPRSHTRASLRISTIPRILSLKVFGGSLWKVLFVPSGRCQQRSVTQAGYGLATTTLKVLRKKHRDGA